jgi:hypothetical protein
MEKSLPVVLTSWLFFEFDFVFSCHPRSPSFNVDAFEMSSSQWKKVCQLHLMPDTFTTLKSGGTGGGDPHGVDQSGSARTYHHISSLANLFPSTGDLIDLSQVSLTHQTTPHA